MNATAFSCSIEAFRKKQVTADGALATPKMLAKLGPMLGLMGTLIPM